MTLFKKIAALFLFSIIVNSTKVSAQQSNIWYFGDGAGLNFNTTPPQPLTNSAMFMMEGCASICSGTGDILFYTDGMTVYNKMHVSMPNGTGLLGCYSSTNSAIIVPKPGNPDLYYIFTADCEENSFDNGYNYSVVDMRLNGGNGDVTSEKNINLYSPSSEKLTAVKASNGIDYWVITKGIDNNRFSVYKIDCNGVNLTPVNSDVGVILPGAGAGPGAIKASPDGRKLCMAIKGPVAMAALFDFDNNTGNLSNPIQLTGYTSGWEATIYGVEFSPNSKLLYVSTGADQSINQYDLSSGNPTTINSSKYTFSTAPVYSAALQLSPDKRIFQTVPLRPQLSVINNPDVYGAGCDFSLGSVDLAEKQSRSGLPAFVTSFFDFSNKIDFTSSLIDCHAQFTGTSALSGNLVWEWDFGDGTLGNGQIINHSYRQTGIYNVTLKVKRTSIACGGLITDSFTISKPINISNVFAVDFNKTGNCIGDVFSFNDNTVLNTGNITSYAWNFGDGSPIVNTQNTSHVYATTGEYDVKLVVTTNGICGTASITKKIFVDTKPISIFSPVNGCINSAITFNDASTNNIGGIGAWLWSFGDGLISVIQNPAHTYINPGPYTVRLTVHSLHGCKSDELTKPLTIYDVPVANYDIQLPCVNQGTIFTDISASTSGNIEAWQWDFGDGSTSTIQNPTHIYLKPLPYSISLKVKSQFGCISNAKIISLNIGKVPAFAGDDITAFYDTQFQLWATGGSSYVWSPVTGLSNPFIANPSAILREDITYTVKVTDNNGCFASDEVAIKIYNNNEIWMPNSFTPNSDSNNDLLKPLGFGLKKIEYFKIYNRYGQLIFITSELNQGWDGTFKGEKQPIGTYTFMVKAINNRNKPVESIGTVILIR